MRRVRFSVLVLSGAVFSLSASAGGQESPAPDVTHFRYQLALWLEQASLEDVDALDQAIRFVASHESSVSGPARTEQSVGVNEMATQCVVRNEQQVCNKYRDLLGRLRTMDPKPFEEARATESE